MKVKYVKAIQENISKFYAQVITDTYVEIVVVELCFEIKTKETFQRSTFSKLVFGIPCSLMFPIKNGGDGEGGGGVVGREVKRFLLIDQNLLSITKVICRGFLSGWLLSLEVEVYLEKFTPSPEM